MKIIAPIFLFLFLYSCGEKSVVDYCYTPNPDEKIVELTEIDIDFFRKNLQFDPQYSAGMNRKYYSPKGYEVFIWLGYANGLKDFENAFNKNNDTSWSSFEYLVTEGDTTLISKAVKEGKQINRYVAYNKDFKVIVAADQIIDLSNKDFKDENLPSLSLRSK